MKTIFYTLVIVFVFIAGCKKENPEDIIRTDILISFRFENENVIINAETEKEFECSNYSIINSVEQVGENITISFEDFVKPEGCFAAFGPAIAKINLGILKEGIYFITFILDGVQTEVTLHVDCSLNKKVVNSGNVKLK